LLDYAIALTLSTSRTFRGGAIAVQDGEGAPQLRDLQDVLDSFRRLPQVQFAAESLDRFAGPPQRTEPGRVHKAHLAEMDDELLQPVPGAADIDSLAQYRTGREIKLAGHGDFDQAVCVGSRRDVESADGMRPVVATARPVLRVHFVCLPVQVPRLLDEVTASP